MKPTRVDDLIRRDHYWLRADDKCYFLREYTARGGYAHSETNQLIWNLKKKPDRRGRPEWPYKGEAITQAARELREAVAGPEGGDGKPVFHALPRISDVGVADLLQIIRTRVMRFLVRRRVIEADPDADTMLLPDDLAERDPALAQLAAAAVSGLPPAGPELRRKPLKIALPVGSGPKVVRPLCVDDGGFSLHAATRAGAEDDLGREHLFKYVLRPPIAQEHVTLTADGLVAVKLKRPFRDGTVSVEMDPLSLISRLAASVHPPRFHSVRYGGVLAPHSNWRSLIVPSPPPAAIGAPTDVADPGCHSLPPKDDESAKPPTHRCRYRPWHELMRRCMKIDVETCGRCGGKMRLVALVKDAENIARYLRHLGLPTDVPPLAPARGPPFWQSTVLRRRYGEPADAADA